MDTAPADRKPEAVSPTEVPEDLPLPSDPKVIFLGGLFILALLAAAYVAREIVLPFVFAIVLKLLLQPAFRILERWHLPRTVRMRGKWPDRPPRLPSRFPTWRHRSALRLCLVARPKKSNNLCTLAARGIQ